MTETTYPVYGEITGPIVMIGFGSIGRGTLPLIERHFKFDKSMKNADRTNYALRETLRKEKFKNPGGATAISTCGANRPLRADLRAYY